MDAFHQWKSNLVRDKVASRSLAQNISKLFNAYRIIISAHPSQLANSIAQRTIAINANIPAIVSRFLQCKFVERSQFDVEKIELIKR